MMKLYNNAQSRGMTLFPLLKELGIAEQIDQIQIAYEDMHKADYLKINPMGKVPRFFCSIRSFDTSRLRKSIYSVKGP